MLARVGAGRTAAEFPADPRALIRRVYFDLTGLPPTFEEVETFLPSRGMGHSRGWSMTCWRGRSTVSAGPDTGSMWHGTRTAIEQSTDN